VRCGESLGAGLGLCPANIGSRPSKNLLYKLVKTRNARPSLSLSLTQSIPPTLIRAHRHRRRQALASGDHFRGLSGTVRPTRRQSPLSPGLSREQFQDTQRAAVALRRGAREREALQLEIAFILRIAIQTVAFHSDNIKRALGLRTRAELTKYMIEQR
jgi:hypothetical protein